MFTPRQHMLFFTVFAVILAFFIGRIGALDSGAALLWGGILGIALYRLQRRNILVREDLDTSRAKGHRPGSAASPDRLSSDTPAPATMAAAAPDQPPKLDAPRGGKADDLTRITGVGPKLKANLNDMGYYHFDQIAAWSPRETAWMDENLPGAAGRVSRDDWVEQARALVADPGND